MVNNTVPNQRTLVIHKEPTDKDHLYYVHNLEALAEAAHNLKNTSFKLYIYLAKNQDKYSFGLSSKDFTEWAGVSRPAYLDAFKDLEEKEYLIPNIEGSTSYTFYDKSQKKLQEDNIVTIEIPKEKVKEVKEAKEKYIF